MNFWKLYLLSSQDELFFKCPTCSLLCPFGSINTKMEISEVVIRLEGIYHVQQSWLQSHWEWSRGCQAVAASHWSEHRAALKILRVGSSVLLQPVMPSLPSCIHTCSPLLKVSKSTFPSGEMWGNKSSTHRICLERRKKAQERKSWEGFMKRACVTSHSLQGHLANFLAFIYIN